MLNFIRGFCMALADSVPGVSGGTVAFLLGFYDKFIMSLDYLMSGTKEERIEAKHNGNKTKDATLKLALNGLSGWI